MTIAISDDPLGGPRLLSESHPAPPASDSNGRVTALGRIALFICEHPALRELGLFVYHQIRAHLAVDSLYVALAEAQSEGLRGILFVQAGREFPAQDLHIAANGLGAGSAPPFVSRDQLGTHVAYGGDQQLSSCVTCAIRSEGRQLGELSVASHQADAYSIEDGQFIQVIADMYSSAVERELAHTEALEREAELQASIGKSQGLSSSTSIDVALRELAQGLVKVTGSDAVIVTLRDGGGDTGMPVAYAASGGATLDGLLEPHPLNPIFARLGGQNALVERAGESPAMRWGTSGVWRSQLTLPLSVENQWLGVVEIGSRNPDYRFSDHVVDTCGVIVQQASLGIHHVRLSESAAEQTTSLTGIAGFADALGNAPDDLDGVLHLICDEARRLLHMSHASLYLLNAPEHMLELRARSGLAGAQEIGARMQIDDRVSVIARAVRDKRVIVETDASKISSSGGAVADRPIEIGRAKSLIVAPLRHNGVSLGVLLLSDRRRRKGFQPDEIRLLTGVASQAAAALARSQIRAVEQERLQIASVLGTISASIGSEEEPAVTYGLILREAARLISFDQASITVFEDSAVVVSAAIGSTLDKLPQHPATLRLWREPNRLDLDACVRDPGLVRALASAHFADLMSLPLMVSGVVAGRLTFASTRTGQFDAHNAELAALLAERTAHVVGVVKLRVAQKEALAKVMELDEMRQDFVATVSHELRTPLTGILGYLELTLSRWYSLDDDHRREMLQRTQSAATRLEHLVKDLLLFSNVEHQALRLDTSSYLMNMLVDQAAEVMRTKYRGQAVEIKHGDDVTRVLADAQRAVQVIANLIDNAIKYSPIGSTVHVRWRARRKDVEVIVRDHGPGIKPEDMHRLFTRFGTLGHQPRPGQVGSGIGLYVCKKLVEAMDGKIWALSQPGHGSVFHFTLPRSLP